MIPHIFHQFWCGGPLPAEYVTYSETWRVQHPDWEFFQWTDDNLPTMRYVDRFNEASRYARPDHCGAWKANILRYNVLELLGGVWIDYDMECLQPIDQFCEVSAFIGKDTPTQIQTAIIGAAPNHSYITASLDGLVALPPYPHRALSSVMVANQVPLVDVVIHEPSVFYPVDHVTGEGDTTDAYAVHRPRAAEIMSDNGRSKQEDQVVRGEG